MSLQEAREFLHLMTPVIVIIIPIAAFMIVKYSRSDAVRTFIFPLISVSCFFCLFTLLGGDVIEEQYNKRIIHNYKSTEERYNVGSENYYSVRTYTSNDKNAITKEFTIRFLTYSIAIISLFCSFKIFKFSEARAVKG